MLKQIQKLLRSLIMETNYVTSLFLEKSVKNREP